jgi:hypothetical protein
MENIAENPDLVEGKKENGHSKLGGRLAIIEEFKKAEEKSKNEEDQKTKEQKRQEMLDEILRSCSAPPSKLVK